MFFSRLNMRSIHILNRNLKIKFIVLLAVITFHLMNMWQFIHSFFLSQPCLHTFLCVNCQCWLECISVDELLDFMTNAFIFYDRLLTHFPNGSSNLYSHQQYMKVLWLFHCVGGRRGWCLRARFWHHRAWVQTLALPLTRCVSISFYFIDEWYFILFIHSP